MSAIKKIRELGDKLQDFANIPEIPRWQRIVWDVAIAAAQAGRIWPEASEWEKVLGIVEEAELQAQRAVGVSTAEMNLDRATINQRSQEWQVFRATSRLVLAVQQAKDLHQGDRWKSAVMVAITVITAGLLLVVVTAGNSLVAHDVPLGLGVSGGAVIGSAWMYWWKGRWSVSVRKANLDGSLKAAEFALEFLKLELTTTSDFQGSSRTIGTDHPSIEALKPAVAVVRE